MCVTDQESKGFGQHQNCLEDAPKARPLDPLQLLDFLKRLGRGTETKFLQEEKWGYSRSSGLSAYVTPSKRNACDQSGDLK